MTTPNGEGVVTSDDAPWLPNFWFVTGAGDGGVGSLLDRTQPNITSLLQSSVQSSANWLGSSAAVFDGLNAALGLPLGIVEALVKRLFGVDIPITEMTQALDLIREVPILSDLIEIITGVEDGDENDLGSFFLGIRNAFAGIDLSDPGSILTAIAAAIAEALDDVPLIGPIVEALIGHSGDLGDLSSWAGALLGGESPLNALNLFNLGNIFGSLSIGNLTLDQQELLDNPDFRDAVSIQGGGIWIWDETDGYEVPGCANVIANSILRQLMSNTIAVAEGDDIDISVRSKWSGLTYTGTAPIKLQVVELLYDHVTETFATMGTHDVVATPSPGANQSTWTLLSGAYVVPASVSHIALQLHVGANATGGTIKFDKGSAKKTGLLQIPWTEDLPDSLQDLLNGAQETIDAVIEGITGLSSIGGLITDLMDALRNIPGTSVHGAGGLPNVIDTFTTMWDNVTSALRLFGVNNVGLDELADAAQNTSSDAGSAFQQSVVNQNVLAIRTNNSVIGGLERTTVANMNLSDLGTGATPLSFGVTQTASAIGLCRMPESDTKGVLYFRTSGTTSVSGFYLNFGKMALDGTVTHLFQSANLIGQLTSGWQWQSYTFPGVSQIVHNASEVLVVEYIVTGTGTVTIAGLPMAWQTDNHPTATTARTGATRNTGGGTPTLSNTGFNFSGNTPYTGLGRATVPADYVPPQVDTFPNSGAYSYPLPGWLQVGDLVDYGALGSGGGGGAGGYGLPNAGGNAGNWQSGTLVVGTHVAPGATITGSVGGAAGGGINPFTLDAGDNGNSTTIVVPGFGTITATGGTGGGRSGTSGVTGKAAGNRTVGDFTMFGGGAAGQNQSGNPPGGGGGSGYPASGFASGKGKVWFRARQA